MRVHLISSDARFRRVNTLVNTAGISHPPCLVNILEAGNNTLGPQKLLTSASAWCTQVYE